jgi:hypothetical protein
MADEYFVITTNENGDTKLTSHTKDDLLAKFDENYWSDLSSSSPASLSECCSGKEINSMLWIKGTANETCMDCYTGGIA